MGARLKLILSSFLASHFDGRFCKLLGLKLGKKTSRKEVIKKYYASKRRSPTLKNLTVHLTVRSLGLNALKVDNINSHVRVITYWEPK